MDAQTRTVIIASAYAAVGPIPTSEDAEQRAELIAQHRARVIDAIAGISVAAEDEKSWANKAIDQVTGPNVKIFTGVVEKVSREKATTRGIVYLRTRVHAEYAPEGVEQVRTERTDDPVGLAMAQRLRGLQGHRVLLRVEIESFTSKSGGSSRKARVVRHVEDLGIPAAADDDADADVA